MSVGKTWVCPDVVIEQIKVRPFSVAFGIGLDDVEVALFGGNAQVTIHKCQESVARLTRFPLALSTGTIYTSEKPRAVGIEMTLMIDGNRVAFSDGS